MFEKYIAIIKEKIGDVSDIELAKEIILPERDWKHLVGLFLVLNLFIAGLSAYYYYYINNDDTFAYGGGFDASISSANRNKLEKAIAYLKEKEAKENYLLSHRPSISDPSK